MNLQNSELLRSTNLVAGKWISADSALTLPVINPADGVDEVLPAEGKLVMARQDYWSFPMSLAGIELSSEMFSLPISTRLA